MSRGGLFAQMSRLVRIRLTKKLAEVLNGVDVSRYEVGEAFDLTDPLAQMLITERWAEEAIPFDSRSQADDRPPPKNRGGESARAERVSGISKVRRRNG